MNHNTHEIPLPFVTFQYTFELQVIFTRMKTTTFCLFNALVSIMYAARAFNVNFLIIYLMVGWILQFPGQYPSKFEFPTRHQHLEQTFLQSLVVFLLKQYHAP